MLWVTDPAAPAPRPTKDVDVVVEVTSRASFHEFEARLRALGFKEDQEDGMAEVRDSESDVRLYLATELKRLRGHPRFREGVSGALQADAASQARAEAVVLPRIEHLIDES